MSEQLQEFFALEAGEYLARLERLLAGAERPDCERLFRLARSVRGSAEMAEAEAVARAARGLEAAARALCDGRIVWDEGVRERLADTVEDLRTLVAATTSGPPDESRADAAAARWSHLLSPARREPAAQEERMRSFVERELGAVLLALERVIVGYGDEAAAADEWRPLLQRMRPIRGLSGVAELAPLTEVLEGVEQLARELLHGGRTQLPDDVERLKAAREALRAFRRSLRAGVPAESERADDEEAISVTALFAAEEAEPVPIAQLELRGAAAVRAALELRPRLQSMARSDAAAGELLAELWELLELALPEAG